MTTEIRREQNRKSQQKYYEINRIVILERTKKWREDHPEKIYKAKRKHQLKKFNLSLEEYDDLFEIQGGVCAICGEKSNIKLAVDHNHITGKVRGLLCGSCNLLLGNAKENPDTLYYAAKYLRERQ